VHGYFAGSLPYGKVQHLNVTTAILLHVSCQLTENARGSFNCQDLPRLPYKVGHETGEIAYVCADIHDGVPGLDPLLHEAGQPGFPDMKEVNSNLDEVTNVAPKAMPKECPPHSPWRDDRIELDIDTAGQGFTAL
jgi:hypothetical protein